MREAWVPGIQRRGNRLASARVPSDMALVTVKPQLPSHAASDELSAGALGRRRGCSAGGKPMAGQEKLSRDRTPPTRNLTGQPAVFLANHSIDSGSGPAQSRSAETRAALPALQTKSAAVRQGACAWMEHPRLSDGISGTEPSAQPSSPPSANEEMDWPILVTRCLHGDNAAWAELVKAHHGRVYSLCYRFSGSRPDAEDLTQEVFLKVYRNLHSYELAKGRFQTWLTTIARNLLVDHFRRTRMQRATSSIDAAEEQGPEMLSSSDPSPYDSAARREMERMVQGALVQLPMEFREVVILRDLEQMDYREIAQMLHIPEGTVKSRISRGRAELARLLERKKGQVV